MPQSSMAAFQRVFEDNGGKIVKKLWPPLVTADYTPFIAQVGNVDAVFNGFAGSNPVKFMRSYADLGLKGRIALLAGWTGMDDALLVVPALLFEFWHTVTVLPGRRLRSSLVAITACLLGFIPFGLECWVMWQAMRVPLDGLAEPLPDERSLL